MLKNYFTIALRNLYTYWVYSLLNIVGLAVGISFFALLFIVVKYELSFDKIHQKADRIYRVVEKVEQSGVGEESASLPFMFAPTICRDFGLKVESAVRIFNFQISSHSVSYGKKRDNESKFYFADSTFFKIFDYPLALGNPENALENPNSVVISKEMAEKYFGESSPLGQIIYYEDRVPLKVTGVFSSKYYASHFEFDFVASLSAVRDLIHPNGYNSWFWNPCWTYILLREDVSQTALENILPQIVAEYFPESLKKHVKLYLQALTDIHLTSSLDYEISDNKEKVHVRIFTVIAILILIITIINFTNLSTARYAMRAKEIGIRKVIGADKWELIQQFLVESLFLSALGTLCSFAFIELLLPYITELTNRDITYEKIDKTTLVSTLLGAGLSVGLLSSIYPSYYLSRFLPAEVMNSERFRPRNSSYFRRILVILQFCITIYLLISTMVSFRQLSYMRNGKTGFEKKKIIVLPLPNTAARERFDAIKQALLQNKGIRSVTVSEEILGVSHQTHPFYMETAQDRSLIFLPSLSVGYDFIETFNIRIIAGRSFAKDSLDEISGIIVNQKFVDFMGWGSPQEALGKPLNSYFGKEKVIGVAENFNFEALYEEVTPIVLDIPSDPAAKIAYSKYVSIALEGENSAHIIPKIEAVWHQFIPNRTFEYFFLNKRISKLYLSELKLGKISANFSLVAIFIACLGIFGLSAFMVGQRKKEIAIRKALGTTNLSIVFLLSGEFSSLVGIALLISWPFSYLMLDKWLSRFPFRIDMSPFPFLASGVIVFLITILTVSYHTIKAATSNPARDLSRS